MATGAQWNEHFHNQFNSHLKTTREALRQLQQDELIYKEFKSLGLFELIYFIDEELIKRKL